MNTKTVTPTNSALSSPSFTQAASMMSGFLWITLALVGAFMAGRLGLFPKLEPLLLDPRTSALGVILFGVFVLFTLVEGTLAKAQDGQLLGSQWSSMWLPIKIALLAGLFMPAQDHLSVFMHSLLWAAKLGVS